MAKKWKQELEAAICHIEKEKNVNWLRTIVRQSLDNPAIAIALLKKIIPDQVKGEGFDNKIQLVNVVVREITGEETSGNKRIESEHRFTHESEQG